MAAAKNTRKYNRCSPLLAVILLILPSLITNKTFVLNLDKIRGEITTLEVSLGYEIGAPNAYAGLAMQPCFKLLELSYKLGVNLLY